MRIKKAIWNPKWLYIQLLKNRLYFNKSVSAYSTIYTPQPIRYLAVARLLSILVPNF